MQFDTDSLVLVSAPATVISISCKFAKITKRGEKKKKKSHCPLINSCIQRKIRFFNY